MHFPRLELMHIAVRTRPQHQFTAKRAFYVTALFAGGDFLTSLPGTYLYFPCGVVVVLPC